MGALRVLICACAHPSCFLSREEYPEAGRGKRKGSASTVPSADRALKPISCLLHRRLITATASVLLGGLQGTIPHIPSDIEQDWQTLARCVDWMHHQRSIRQMTPATGLLWWGKGAGLLPRCCFVFALQIAVYCTW
jgi:hypothetical protein